MFRGAVKQSRIQCVSSSYAADVPWLVLDCFVGAKERKLGDTVLPVLPGLLLNKAKVRPKIRLKTSWRRRDHGALHAPWFVGRPFHL
jgi:hypothetical protein